MTRGASIWFPETLDPDALLARYGRRVGEEVLLLGSIVLERLAADKRCREAGAASLKTQTLRSIFGSRRLEAVRRSAVEAEYVVRSSGYQVGERSQGYGIHKRFASVPLSRRRVEDHEVARRLQTRTEKRRQENMASLQATDAPGSGAVYDHLWRSLQEVELDDRLDFRGLHPTSMITATRLQEKTNMWFRADRHGRLHSPVTSLPKRLRADLHFGGERLADVDISASQAVFLARTLIDEYGHTCISKPGKRNSASPSSLMLRIERPTGNVSECLPDDLKRFVELIERGELYELVAERLKRTRADAKRLWLTATFDRAHRRSAVADMIKSEFPSVFDGMCRIKRGGYKRLAHRMQRAEADHMFGAIIPAVMGELPGMPILTVHDACLVPCSYAERVCAIMRASFELVGVRPQIKIEPC